MAHRPMAVVAVRIVVMARVRVARRKPITTKPITTKPITTTTTTAVAACRVGAVSVRFFRVHVQVLFLGVQLVVVSVKGFNIVEAKHFE